MNLLDSCSTFIFTPILTTFVKLNVVSLDYLKRACTGFHLHIILIFHRRKVSWTETGMGDPYSLYHMLGNALSGSADCRGNVFAE